MLGLFDSDFYFSNVGLASSQSETKRLVWSFSDNPFDLPSRGRNETRHFPFIVPIKEAVAVVNKMNISNVGFDILDLEFKSNQIVKAELEFEVDIIDRDLLASQHHVV